MYRWETIKIRPLRLLLPEVVGSSVPSTEYLVPSKSQVLTWYQVLGPLVRPMRRLAVPAMLL
jgi:hypothetical protein